MCMWDYFFFGKRAKKFSFKREIKNLVGSKFKNKHLGIAVEMEI